MYLMETKSVHHQRLYPLDDGRQTRYIALLDKRIHNLAEQVEMTDVATPGTYERYRGVWQGSFEGWNMNTKTFGMRMKKTLPKLKSFYMAGQWVEPGGSILACAVSGRNVIQILCKKEKKPFTADIA